jgi:hypothetical protein
VLDQKTNPEARIHPSKRVGKYLKEDVAVPKDDLTSEEHSLPERGSETRSRWQTTHASDTLAAPILQFDLEIERKNYRLSPRTRKADRRVDTRQGG